MAGNGRYFIGRDEEREERVDLRRLERDDDTSALDAELERALARSKERMDRVGAKADQLKRALRRPNSYPQIEAAFAKKFGT